MSDAKKRKKAYYVQAGRAKKQHTRVPLDAGMRGFLITCNNAEKKAVPEAYNLLNEYADMIYGSEKIEASDEKSDHSDVDFESAIQQEVEALTKHAAVRRFQVVETKTNNCVFIKTPLEHPDELVTKIFADLSENQISKSRFILKLFPVLGTCRATEDKIEKLAEEVLSPFLKGVDGLSFCVIFKVRCNNTLNRESVIDLVARVVGEINPLVKVKFDNPDLVISVDILQKICCLSVLKSFHKFRKYNVQEIITANSAAEIPNSSDAVEEAANVAHSEMVAEPVGVALESQDHDDKAEAHSLCGLKPDLSTSSSDVVCPPTTGTEAIC